MSEQDRLTVFGVGDAKIVTPTEIITPAAETLFAAALYLILNRRETLARAEIEQLLWPTVAKAQAGHRLRQTLLKLRQCGVPIETVGKTLVKLGPIEVVSDFSDLQNHEVNSILNGERSLTPFAGFAPTFSAPFAEWLDQQKTLIVSRIAHPLLARISGLRLQGEWTIVESFATALLQVDPSNEEAVLALAECKAMRGSKDEAQRMLDDYVRDAELNNSSITVQTKLLRRRIVDHYHPQLPPSGDTPLIGRRAAMERLSAMLQQAKRGNTRCIVVAGDAGIGKTRLLAELSQFAALQGFQSVRVNVRPSHHQRPLSTFVSLVPYLQALPGSIGCSADTLRFLDLLTKHEPRRGARGNDPEESVWTFGGVQTALFDLIDAVSEESPVLIQVEDGHWMDAASVDVLQELLQRLESRRVLFAVTARSLPDTWESDLADRVQIMNIAPLAEAESRELLSKLLLSAKRAGTDAFSEWCIRVAEGNPYFLAELANHWLEGGANRDMPHSLSALLNQRISRLDLNSLQVLQTCALLENNSTLRRIEAVLEHNAHELLRSINSLGASDMIISENRSDAQNEARISTKHELLSNVALAQLTPPAKQFLHRRIGEILELEVDSHFSAETLWDCAKHWQLAGDNRHAWYLATSCAVHLMNVGLPSAAFDAYQRALAFCTTDAERVEVLSGAATASYRMSSWAELRDTISRVRLLQSRISRDVTQHDDLELMDLRAQWQTLQWDHVLNSVLECLRCPDASPTHRAEAGVMALMLLGFQCDQKAIIECYDAIESVCNDDSVSELTKLKASMVFHTNFGDMNDGIEAARTLVRELSSSGDIGELFRANCNAGVACRVAGQFDEAMSFFSQALEIADKHNLPAAKQRAIPLIANMELEIGRFDEARAWHLRLCGVPLDPSDRYAFVEREAIALRLALASDAPQEARKHVPMTFDEAIKDPIHHRRSYNLALRIAAMMACGEVVSVDAIEKLEESFATSRTSVHQSFSAFILYVALAKHGQLNRAEQTLRDYETIHRREPWPASRQLLATIARSCGLSSQQEAA
jgi:DNA-binding SARP family transcriptional activator/tetratricopeptide (TPR) repeat protein